MELLKPTIPASRILHDDFCDECQQSDIISDPVTGDTICRICGSVLSEKMTDSYKSQHEIKLEYQISKKFIPIQKTQLISKSINKLQIQINSNLSLERYVSNILLIFSKLDYLLNKKDIDSVIYYLKKIPQEFLFTRGQYHRNYLTTFCFTIIYYTIMYRYMNLQQYFKFLTVHNENFNFRLLYKIQQNLNPIPVFRELFLTSKYNIPNCVITINTIKKQYFSDIHQIIENNIPIIIGQAKIQSRSYLTTNTKTIIQEIFHQISQYKYTELKRHNKYIICATFIYYNQHIRGNINKESISELFSISPSTINNTKNRFRL